MTRINLQFKQPMVALAGNPFGKRTFNEQVKPKITDKDDSVVIVFPDQITHVTSSFIQGFFSTWLRDNGPQIIKKKVKIESKHKRIIDYVWDSIS
ncbi:MAG: DUF4325 domain-containing protein [Clostridia bacterium]|nr:DUF4325 domain-containing protein [Clostridia bacterium]